uniref:Uncharacterized protein n=1 Tax=Anopheles atroparvus TaxID=41427 RepID=A0AAG5D5U6_ANOAO
RLVNGYEPIAQKRTIDSSLLFVKDYKKFSWITKWISSNKPHVRGTPFPHPTRPFPIHHFRHFLEGE